MHPCEGRAGVHARWVLSEGGGVVYAFAYGNPGGANLGAVMLARCQTFVIRPNVRNRVVSQNSVLDDQEGNNLAPVALIYSLLKPEGDNCCESSPNNHNPIKRS